jgi:hypothetical protein
MSDKTLTALKSAIADHLGGDESAAVTVVEQDAGPDMALIRADALEVLKQKAAQFDALSGGDEESEQDAMSLLSGE